MKRLLTILLLLGIAAPVYAAPPSRVYTYTAGNIIEPDEVTANEDAIYSYLQTGVDTYALGTVNSTAILDGTVATIDIAGSNITTALILNDTILLEDMGNDSVSTNEIVNLTIVNGDISASAAISASKLADNEIDQEELNSTITFSDGDLISFASINTSSSTEGVRLPQTTSCTSGTAEGQICWDTDNDWLSIGDSSTTESILPAGTPSLTLGTSNTAGSAVTTIRSDATILAFDATLPAALGAAATGSATVAARRDHVHAFPEMNRIATTWDPAAGTSGEQSLDTMSGGLIHSAYINAIVTADTGGAGANDIKVGIRCTDQGGTDRDTAILDLDSQTNSQAEVHGMPLYHDTISSATSGAAEAANWSAMDSQSCDEILVYYSGGNASTNINVTDVKVFWFGE